jgi:hypothetical protein
LSKKSVEERERDKNMGQFVVATILNIRPFGEGDRVYHRILDLQLANDVQQEVHGSRSLTNDLIIGKQYDFLVSPLGWKFVLGQSNDPHMWTGQILAVDWKVSADQFSRLTRRETPLDDFVLIEAPFGRVGVSYSVIGRISEIPKKDITVGAFLSWSKKTRYNLIGVV